MNELNVKIAEQIAQQFGKTIEEVKQLFNSCGTSEESFLHIFQTHTANNYNVFEQEVLGGFMASHGIKLHTGPLDDNALNGLLWC